ncbi:MAG TPA: DUF3352 domain-containing protein [Aggregatilineales bacterium]|nr:DUF3352 domain-containing protein [Aggregatilineales bacterium]
MFSRMLRVVLILSIVLAGLLTLNVSGAQITALAAAPGSQSVADMLPDETALYFDVRTDKISDVLALLNSLSTKVSGHPLPDVFAQIDQGLTQALGRKASFQNDIQPWLGDHIGLGLMISDADLAQLNAMASGSNATTNKGYMPAYAIVMPIKDDAKFGAFFKELWAKVPPSEQSNYSNQTQTVAGKPVTILHQTGGCPSNCVDLAMGSGFAVAGSADGVTRLLDTLNGKKTILSRNANYSKLSGSMKPTDFANVYVSPRALSLELLGIYAIRRTASFNSAGSPATPQANPADQAMALLKEAFSIYNGQMIGIRHDGNVVALDVAQSLNVQALNKYLTDLGFPAGFATAVMPKPLSGTLTNQIPAKSVAVVQSNGLGNYYDALKGTLKAYQKMGVFQAPQPNLNFGRGMPDLGKAIVGLGMFEGGFNAAFNMDFRNDVLALMNGDFAFYTMYDPNSTLSKASKNGKRVPLDLTLIAQVSDTTRLKAALGKFNTGIKQLTNIGPTSAGLDLYQITTQTGVTIGYGLVGSTFVLTAGSTVDSAVAAIKGDGTVASDPVWKAAQTSGIQQPAQFFFLNFNRLAEAIKAEMPSGQTTSMTANMKQGLALLDALDSATLSSAALSPDGFSQGTLQIALKP